MLAFMQHINKASSHSGASEARHPLADERYIALTTYTRAGTPKSVPVWPVDAGDGRLGFVTSSHTWKVKRLRNDPRVQLRPSDSRGRPKADGQVTTGIAEVVLGEQFEAVNLGVKQKYGYQLKLINLLHALPGAKTGHPNDAAVIITVDQP